MQFENTINYGLAKFIYQEQGVSLSLGVLGGGYKLQVQSAYIKGGLEQGFSYQQSLLLSGDTSEPLSTDPDDLALEAEAMSDSVASDSQSFTNDKNILGTIDHDQTTFALLKHSSSDELLKSITALANVKPLWQFVAAFLTGVYCLYLYAAAMVLPIWTHASLLAVFALVVGWVYMRDQYKNLTALFFDLDEDTSIKFASLCDATQALANTGKFEYITSTGWVANRKYSAGAKQMLETIAARAKVGHVKPIVANYKVPVLRAGKNMLALYPDRALFFRDDKIAEISYADLNVSTDPIEYVEYGRVARDGRVVKQTWKYVNKDGSRDRRFKENKQYPVCEYHQIGLLARSGAELQFLCSNERISKGFVDALGEMKTKSAARKAA